ENVTIGSLSASDFVFDTSGTALTSNGTSGYDTLFGGTGKDQLSGSDGNDTLVGGAGNDELRGGTGSDRFFGGAGTDTVTYFGTNSGVTVNLQAGTGSGGEAQGDTFGSVENVNGSNAADTLIGNAIANRLQGYDGSDTLQGGDGNDVLVGGAEADRLEGGAGVDGASYYGETAAVTVDLSAGKGSGGNAQGDILVSIENVSGSKGNDTLTGNAGANSLAGYEGNDVLRGGAGADRLDGGTGTDTVSYYTGSVGVAVDLATGKANSGEAQGDTLIGIENVSGSQGGDMLTGNAGANTLQGWNGNDVLRGGAGADRLDGGAGIDTVSYYTSETGVTVNLSDGTGERGDAQGDRLAGVENVSGSQGGDWLIGSIGANTLQGWNGDDTLWGAQGKDTLTGGIGADRFFYYAASESAVGANADRITDFSQVQGDRIDLSQIDTNTGASGDQAFSFIGTGTYTGVAGQLRYGISNGVTTIAGDMDGDKVSDFHISLTGAISLQASDFVL
ncbi:M10 family metallopeptidase C-terminal domain-containing protein, partial [Inquilinus limosus]